MQKRSKADLTLREIYNFANISKDMAGVFEKQGHAFRNIGKIYFPDNELEVTSSARKHLSRPKKCMSTR